MNLDKPYYESPYWEAAKYAFAIAGGAVLAGTIVRAGYKLIRKGAQVIVDTEPGSPVQPDKPENTEKEEEND